LAGGDADKRARIEPVPELKPEIEGVNVVLVGSLNPAIFQPAWLAREKLIPLEEAERAEIRVISPQVSVFSIGWLNLEITLDRFAANTSQMQHMEPLRDLIVGTFSLLRHTPIKHLGINRLAHFRSRSEEEWHRLGHRLAPKAPWEGLLKQPGMRRVSMLGQRDDGYRGGITVTVEPSQIVKPGVYVEVNDHYENDVSQEGGECERILGILKACWETSLDRGSQIMQKLIKDNEIQ
jgi:hypothetical protein